MFLKPAFLNTKTFWKSSYLSCLQYCSTATYRPAEQKTTYSMTNEQNLHRVNLSFDETEYCSQNPHLVEADGCAHTEYGSAGDLFLVKGSFPPIYCRGVVLKQRLDSVNYFPWLENFIKLEVRHCFTLISISICST